MQDILIHLGDYGQQLKSEDGKLQDTRATVMRLAAALKGYRKQIESGEVNEPEIKELVEQFKQSISRSQRIASRRATLRQYRRRFERRLEQKRTRLKKARTMIPMEEKRMSNAGAYRTDFLYLVQFIRRNVSLEKSETSGEDLAAEMRRFLKTGGKIREELAQLGDLTRDFVDEAISADFPDLTKEADGGSDVSSVDIVSELRRLWDASDDAKKTDGELVKQKTDGGTNRKENK